MVDIMKLNPQRTQPYTFIAKTSSQAESKAYMSRRKEKFTSNVCFLPHDAVCFLPHDVVCFLPHDDVCFLPHDAARINCNKTQLLNTRRNDS